MIYYVISGKNIDGTKGYVGLDVEEDFLHWMVNGWDSTISKFDTSAQAEAFIAARKEFNYIENDGTDILMPIMLRNVDTVSIAIEKVSLFEFEKAVDFSTVLAEYRTRSSEFDIKFKELSEI